MCLLRQQRFALLSVMWRSNFFSSTYCSNLNCIYLLQKLIVWLISEAHYLANTAPLFSKLKVLDICSINSYFLLLHWSTYSYHQNLLPSCFRNLFLSSNQVHHYETQLASLYRPHFRGTNIKQFSILYRGPTIWNFLPVTLTSSSSIFDFFKNLKNYLIDSHSIA